MSRSDACQLGATGHSSSRPQDSFWNREWASFLITINLQGGQTPGSLLVIRFSSMWTLENGREQSLTLLTSAGFTRRARSSRHQTGSELSNAMRFVQWKLKKDEENGLLFSFLNQKKEDICVDSNTARYKPSNVTNYNLCLHTANGVHMVKQVANVIHLF